MYNNRPIKRKPKLRQFKQVSLQFVSDPVILSCVPLDRREESSGHASWPHIRDLSPPLCCGAACPNTCGKACATPVTFSCCIRRCI